MMTTTLEIHLNGSRYPVACPEAEAPRVKAMAQKLQERLSTLHQDLGHAQVSDAHLMALMGLILMDELTEKTAVAETTESARADAAAAKAELAETRTQLAAARAELAEFVAEFEAKPPEPAKTDEQDNEELFVNAVTHLTQRVNSIAQKLRAA